MEVLFDLYDLLFPPRRKDRYPKSILQNFRGMCRYQPYLALWKFLCLLYAPLLLRYEEIQMGLNQAFSTWIYVKDFNYKFGEYKNILWKGNPGSGSNSVHSPSIWLYPLTNSLKVVTSTQDVSGVESCDIPNIPLMTWVHIGYVLNNRTVDIYINGKLERSCALKGIPVLSTESQPVYMTGGTPDAGFYGKIGKTQYFTKSLLPNDIMNLYQQGPLGSTQYQIQFFNEGKALTTKTISSLEESATCVTNSL